MKRACVLLCCLLFAVVSGAAWGEETARPSIEVLGTAEAVLEPDYIEWAVDLQTNHEDPKAALDENELMIAKLKKIMKGVDVNKLDIEIGRPVVKQNMRQPGSKWVNKIDYIDTQVNQLVVFRLRDLDEFTDTLVAVHGLGMRYYSAYKSSAYEQTGDRLEAAALKQAKRRATDQAQVLGQQVGPAVLVDVSYRSPSFSGGLFADDSAPEPFEDDPGVAGKDGRVHVKAYAYVTFELKP